jgi:hypothetical protein
MVEQSVHSFLKRHNNYFVLTQYLVITPENNPTNIIIRHPVGRGPYVGYCIYPLRISRYVYNPYQYLGHPPRTPHIDPLAIVVLQKSIRKCE